MPAYFLHGLTSFDHMGSADVTKLPRWDANGGATVTIISPGLSGVGQAISAPNTLAYKFDPSWDVAVVRVLFKATALSSTRTIFFYGLSDNSAVVSLQLRTDGHLQIVLAQVATTGTFISTGTALSSGTVYAVEFGVYFHDGAGEARVLLNGLEDTSLHLTEITSQSNVGTIDRVIFTNPDGQYDDYHIKTGLNSLRLTDFLSDTGGNPQFRTLFPSADGEYSGFTGASAGNHHLNVDETQANGDTDFLSCSDAEPVGTRESWTMQNFTPISTRIYCLVTNMFLKYQTAGELDLRQFLRFSSADFEAPEGERGTTSYAFYSQYWEKSLVTYDYWSNTEIDDIEIGLTRVEGSGTFSDRVSQGTMTLMYTDAEITAPTPLTTDAAIAGLKQTTHHLSTLFKIQRVDGVFLFFTDHNASIIFDGDTYIPAAGMDASARRRETSLKESNLEVLGAISSDSITIDDLRAGRYRGAKVTEYVVDWRCPWMGAIQTSAYVIQLVTYNGTSFNAQLAGLMSKLRHGVGDVYARPCRHDLGDAGCKVQLRNMAYYSVRVSSVTDKRIFTGNSTDIHGLRPDNWFRFGKLIWKTGSNKGIVSPVKSYLTATRHFELQLPVPFTIQVNDRFDAEPGCNQLFDGDCDTKFDNRVNYGGHPYMPSTDQYLQTPGITD